MILLGATYPALYAPDFELRAWLPIVLHPDVLPHPTVGEPYAELLTATGGWDGPYIFTLVAGTLPAGLTLSSGGLIAGTATDGPVLTPVTLPDGVVEQFYRVLFATTVTEGVHTFTVQAIDASPAVGTHEYTLITWGGPFWWETIGKLPDCLFLSSAGRLAGFPMTVGAFEIGILVTDAVAHQLRHTYTLTVAPRPLEVESQQRQLVPEATRR